MAKKFDQWKQVLRDFKPKVTFVRSWPDATGEVIEMIPQRDYQWRYRTDFFKQSGVAYGLSAAKLAVERIHRMRECDAAKGA